MAAAAQSRVLVRFRHGPVALFGAVRLAVAGGARRRGALRRCAAPTLPRKRLAGILRRRIDAAVSAFNGRPRVAVARAAGFASHGIATRGLPHALRTTPALRARRTRGASSFSGE